MIPFIAYTVYYSQRAGKSISSVCMQIYSGMANITVLVTKPAIQHTALKN